MGEVVKHINLVNYANGFLCMFKAWKRSRTSEEFLDLSWNASQNLQEALESMPNNSELLVNCAGIYIYIKDKINRCLNLVSRCCIRFKST